LSEKSNRKGLSKTLERKKVSFDNTHGRNNHKDSAVKRRIVRFTSEKNLGDVNSISELGIQLPN
jgi:hypothetical protein